MNLQKDDLKAIEKIVDGSVKKIVGDSEKRVISTLSREVNDLADINRAVITRVDQLDLRLSICERKLGLRTR